MSTVLVDRYRVRCPRCGYDADFMVGAGMGDYHATREGRRIHELHADERECDAGDERIVVDVIAKAGSR